MPRFDFEYRKRQLEEELARLLSPDTTIETDTVDCEPTTTGRSRKRQRRLALEEDGLELVEEEGKKKSVVPLTSKSASAFKRAVFKKSKNHAQGTDAIQPTVFRVITHTSQRSQVDSVSEEPSSDVEEITLSSPTPGKYTSSSGAQTPPASSAQTPTISKTKPQKADNENYRRALPARLNVQVPSSKSTAPPSFLAQQAPKVDRRPSAAYTRAPPAPEIHHASNYTMYTEHPYSGRYAPADYPPRPNWDMSHAQSWYKQGLSPADFRPSSGPGGTYVTAPGHYYTRRPPHPRESSTCHHSGYGPQIPPEYQHNNYWPPAASNRYAQGSPSNFSRNNYEQVHALHNGGAKSSSAC